jgi:peroxiredoxin
MNYKSLAWIVGIALVWCAAPVMADESDTRPAIGDKIADFTLTDIRYLPRTLSEFENREAFVLVFTTLECPIVKRSLPKLKQLDDEFRGRGVQFLAINVGLEDSIVDVAEQAVRAGIGFPFTKDFTGEGVAAVGARRTPECVVLDAARVLRYRGRIDSEFRLGGVRPNPGRADLKEALEDLLAKREVRVTETPVDGCLITPPRASRQRDLTYYRDVAPLMKRHCQGCHQERNAAPFSLLTFEKVNAHAEMIAEVVAQRRMPPWYGASGHGEFINNPSLSREEIDVIVDWARGDRLAGDPADAPEPLPPRDEEWLIGEPDLVLRIPLTQTIPATGYVPYRYAVLPYVFLRDTWVQRIEIKPGNPAVVHHCNMGYAGAQDLDRKNFSAEENFITGYVPGGDPMILDSGLAFRIPAGSIVGLQIHYVTTGEETTDRTSVGFVFAKEPIQKQLRHIQCQTSRFRIPPGASHHEVKVSRTIEHDVTGIGMFCHMHLRGKAMRFEAAYPDGSSETLLSVPNYNFEWQSSYRWPERKIKFSAGTRIDCTAHYDNSAFNPYNPDPTREVRFGQQTYDEMMYGFLFFTRDDEALDLNIDPATGHVVNSRPGDTK